MVVGTDQGVIVSVQLLISGQRAEMVFPMAWFSDDGPGLANMAQEAVDAFEIEVIPPLLNCISAGAQVVGLSAEPMNNGGIPYRRNYAFGTHEGNRGPDVAPQQVAVLAAYYPDPADVSPGAPTNSGGQFVPGIAEDDLAAEVIDATLKAAVEIFVAGLVEGFATSSGGVLSRSIYAARNGARDLRKAIIYTVRDYVGTVRRRLLPHN